MPDHITPPAQIAYFSMEIGLSARIPTYSGGLGVLAGDTLRAAADMGLPLVAVTLLHRQGYFQQRITSDGRQEVAPVEWEPSEHLERLEHPSVTVEIEGRVVAVQAWILRLSGIDGHVIPILYLDVDIAPNSPDDRRFTDHLYGGDERYRLAQEIILGIGGRRMLAALGYTPRVYHMNEGHSSLLALDLLRAKLEGPGDAQLAEAIDDVRAACVFTTHTPVPAGHDSFSRDLARRVLGEKGLALFSRLPEQEHAELNMSRLGLALSGFVNGVARRHGEVSRGMFPGHEIHAITNGVHSTSWTSPSFRALFDRHIPQWRHQNYALRLAERIPLDEIVAAHNAAKRALLAEVATRCGVQLDPDVFTIGYARRATAYKRPTLVLRDIERLRAIAARHGRLQLVYSGKAHPRDEEGQRLISEIHGLRARVGPDIQLTYIPGYNMDLGLLLTSGVDLWLNTPRAPLEASGTSGMKASHNGVPNLSVRDGWWVEGCIIGHTGWAIEPHGHHGDDADDAEADQLYRLLDAVVLPMYRDNPHAWSEVMRGSIALAGSYFNAQRMLDEYRVRAYGLG
ncbi:MAG: alpha-glucan family phosphorylase [Myxococcales bacterium]|nr:alpha-glucan family phosphorylase [Myxococcales bacterium]